MCSFSQQKNNATLVKDKENGVDKEILSAGLRYQLYFYFIGGSVERREKKTLVVLGFSLFFSFLFLLFLLLL